MKKLIIAAVVLVAMSAQAFAGPIVTIRIEIGKKSQGCAGFGWCRGTIGAEAKSTIQIDEINNSLIINLDAESVLGKEEYLTASTVYFEEAFTIPADILKALEAKNAITVQQGKYQLIKTRTGYKISIPLNSNITSVR